MNDLSTSGLFAGDDRPIPLEGVKIDARLAGLATEVTVAQRYRNREQVPIEAVYVFPLEEGAAVCGFEARVGSEVVRGRVEERDRAFEIYDDAMADGHGAFLLDQERPNVFTASVGNLRPGEAVEVRISYVALARYEGSDLRLTIPTTVSPRYAPPDAAPEVGQPDAERVNPERWLEVPYGLELKVEVDADPIQRIESPSHAIRTTLRERGARVELAREQAALDRDFVLLVESADPHRPAARLAREDDGTAVCQLTFQPDLSPDAAGGSEVLFLLDCSASMRGDSIDQARRALALSIRALEEGDTFNVVRFGSKHRSLWRRPRPFDEGSLDEATAFIDEVDADLGGTEILPPLKMLLELHRDPERGRQILLLTDGEVANERDVVRLAEEHRDAARVFTFGIGAGASEYLVRELARVTRGASELIFPGERIEPKVLRMFGRVRTPVLDGVRVDWGGLDVEQAPAEVPPVFAGESLTVFGRVRSGTAERVTLHAGERTWSLDLDFEHAHSGGPIPRLWARETIRDLERGVEPRRGSRQKRPAGDERRRQRLVELGRRYGLTSSATSYVAVAERPEGERTDGLTELRKIPIALTMGWGGYGRLTAGRQRVDRLLAGTGAMPLPVDLPAAADAIRPAATAAVAVEPFERAMKAQAWAPTVADVADRVRISLTDAVGDWVTHFRSRRQSPAETRRPSAAEQAPPDRLYALLLTQKADGRFELSPELEHWLGSSLDEARHAVAEHGEAVVATTLVLALLERDEAARADEWRPAARKARAWLGRQSTLFAAGAILDPARVVAV